MPPTPAFRATLPYDSPLRTQKDGYDSPVRTQKEGWKAAWLASGGAVARSVRGRVAARAAQHVFKIKILKVRRIVAVSYFPLTPPGPALRAQRALIQLAAWSAAAALAAYPPSPPTVAPTHVATVHFLC